MTNCIHPLVVIEALAHDFNQSDTVRTRFQGIQANTSTLSFSELDGSEILYSTPPQILAQDMKALSENHYMKIVGGCCGTDGRHIEEIAKVFTGIHHID
jgi:methionine synthase I (cobalamin-dependent)